MYTLAVVTKLRNIKVAVYESNSLALLRLKAFDMLTPHRRAVLFNEDLEAIELIELNEKGYPVNVINDYNVWIE